MDLKVALNIPDCHIPWHDEGAYSIMLEVAKHVDKKTGIDEINIMGDYADFYWVSLHSKLPEAMSMHHTLKTEIDTVRQKLEELRTLFPKAKIQFIEGNHEYRLARYLTAKAPELYDFFTVQDLFRLDDLDIIFHPFGKAQLVRCLGTDYCLRHQPFNMGKHCAAGTAHSKCISLGFGHTHRKQSYTFMDALRRELTCYSMGWLGDRAAPVFSYMDTDNWAQSFQFCFAYGKDWWVQPVDIKNGRAYYDSYIFKA